MAATTLGTPVELSLGGMTCAACANRIETQLNKINGVHATVNYATERAHAILEPGVDSHSLISTVEKAGYTASLQVTEAQSLRGLRRRVLVTALLAIPIIVISMAPPLQFPAWQWVVAVLTLPIVIWSAWPMHRAAVRNLRHGTATMDTLVSVGVTVAYLWSLVALFWGHAGMIGMTHGFSFTLQQNDGLGNLYFEVTAGVTLFVLLGRFIETRAKRESGAALRALSAAATPDVTVLREGVEQHEDVSNLRVGDEFVVRPGETIAADGMVISGESALDTSLITGESLPAEVTPESAVTGGTVNLTGRLVVRATHVGAQTQLAQMVRLVENAQTGKAQVQRLTDRISAVFVPVVFALSVITFLMWMLLGLGASGAISAAVAVLIIACPCALGLAVPTALLVGTGRGAQLGVLITGPDVLEQSRHIDTVVLDKTGTVTTGYMHVEEFFLAADTDRSELLRVAAAAEHSSEHPVAKAIVRAALAELKLPPHDLPQISHFVSVPGRGVTGEVENKNVVVGHAELLRGAGIMIPEQALLAPRTTVWVAWDGQLRGWCTVADQLKAESAKAITELQNMGLRVELLSGDTTSVTARIAAQVGVATFTAGVLPAEKAQHIAQLQASGQTVAMVGDGVNDSVALAQADLGIALSSGTGAAMAAADITLVRADLSGVATALRLSRRTMRVIRQNLWWACGYNMAAIPLAAFGLLNPMLAGAAMALSSLCVVGNSLRLRGFAARTNDNQR